MRIHNIATALVYALAAIAAANRLDIWVVPDQPLTDSAGDTILRIAFVGSAILGVAAVIALGSAGVLLGPGPIGAMFRPNGSAVFHDPHVASRNADPGPSDRGRGRVGRRVAVFRARCVRLGAFS
jgi:hypothetical protein